MLAAYHRAFAAELRAMIGALPIEPGDRVLEVACGDGVYSHWLAERVGPDGQVVASDRSEGYLDRAQRVASGDDDPTSVQFVRADLSQMPFADETFDLVWCAQSLYSLPDPVEALSRMKRVVRSGGVVAVLENDSLHHVLLPWPVPIELAVRRAEWDAFLEQSRVPPKFYVARQLSRVFREAQLASCRERSWATKRQAPLDPDTREFLALYLDDLREHAAHHLDRSTREQFEVLVNPADERSLFADPDLSVTLIDHVAWGIKEAGR